MAFPATDLYPATDLWPSTEDEAAPTPATTPVNVRVRIQFNGTAWTDVSSYVLLNHPFTITVGRADTDEYVQPGRLSGLVLDNRDGRFTVGNASGAYYPNVRSGRKITVDIQDPTTDAWVPRFTGRIDGWPMTWTTNGTRCLTTVSATDMLGDWANKVAPPYLPWKAAQIDTADTTVSLAGYWPMTALSAAGTLDGMGNQGTAPTLFDQAGPPGDPRPLLNFTSEEWPATWGQGYLPTTSATYGLSMWIKVSGDPDGGHMVPLAVLDDAGFAVGVDVTAGAVNFVQVQNEFSSTLPQTLASMSARICDGKWHLISMAVQRNESVPDMSRAWVGVDGGWGVPYTGAEQITANSYDKRVFIGRGEFFPSVRGYSGGTFTAGHLSIWAISQSWKQDIMSLYMSGWGLGSYASTYGPTGRLNELASLCGLPYPSVSGARTGIAHSTPVGTALDLARLVEDTDGGILWADTSGNVRYSGARGNVSPVSITAASVSPGVMVAADGVKIRNSITVTNRTMYAMEERTTTVSVTSSASIAIWGVRAREIVTAWVDPGSDPTYLTDRANELLVTSEDPRIPTLPINLLTLPTATQTAMLGLTVGSALQVTGLPTVGGFASSITMWVEGWTETVGATQWSAVYNMSPQAWPWP